MRARIEAWCREIVHKLKDAELAGDIHRFHRLRKQWLDLQRKALNLGV